MQPNRLKVIFSHPTKQTLGVQQRSSLQMRDDELLEHLIDPHR